ncbi:YbjN domain-containing protein [Synechococcus sp. PCC 6312]|uniref:YbjN domain-containing protein n=1 Tax=Synechococcus sp. (strain ATCC 27167 / PCC 6312) TaxID=195253 RepID=UPI00029F4594|nr:hypothetical protein [Synechococcus sp. PCC 6312]AFY59555.1 hypothetical protein Syn6312_0321 [Synechococcus sp. PCC 6312]
MRNIESDSPTAHPLAKFINHLEFAGYRVQEQGEDWVLNLHPRKTNLFLKQIDNRGILVSTIYGAKQNIGRPDLLEFINSLNAQLLFMKLYLTDEDLIRLETFFEGDYDRTNFSILLENIDLDMQTFLSHELLHSYVE